MFLIINNKMEIKLLLNKNIKQNKQNKQNK